MRIARGRHEARHLLGNRIGQFAGEARGAVLLPAEEDPGVLSVRAIYDYYKSNGISTIVMGASFRNTGEIEALAGCDRLTISPALLEELDAAEGKLERKLSPEKAAKVSPIKIDEKTFRWMLNEDAMATDKLSEGIRAFAKDLGSLRAMIDKELKAAA